VATLLCRWRDYFLQFEFTKKKEEEKDNKKKKTKSPTQRCEDLTTNVVSHSIDVEQNFYM
jgi:hypothetical protein